MGVVNSVVCIGLRACDGQRGRGPRLRGSGRRLERFQLADTLDQRRLAGVGIDRHQVIEHAFDSIRHDKRSRVPQPLPEELLDLLRRPSPCFVATLMPDGSPQLTQTWVTTDGEHIVINIVDGMQKARNIRRDPRVAVNVVDPDEIVRCYQKHGAPVAVWHSHPGGTTTPSEIDYAKHVLKVPMIIVAAGEVYVYEAA